MWDHNDFAFAGHLEKYGDLQHKSIPGIAENTSRASIMLLHLISFCDVYVKYSDRWKYFNNLIDGWAQHLLDNVLVHPDEDFAGFRATNFMDGNNGLFRWGYVTNPNMAMSIGYTFNS